MRILMVTSEAVPFAKTGGLADVCGALPQALLELGHDVRLVMPRYRQVARQGLSPLPGPQRLESNRLTGGSRFVKEIEHRTGIRLEYKRPGRPPTSKLND